MLCTLMYEIKLKKLQSKRERYPESNLNPKFRSKKVSLQTPGSTFSKIGGVALGRPVLFFFTCYSQRREFFTHRDCRTSVLPKR